MKIKFSKNQNFFKSLKRCKGYRKGYYIKPQIEFCIDSELFCFLPTVMFVPHIYRYTNCYVFEVAWINIHIGIGLFLPKKGEK